MSQESTVTLTQSWYRLPGGAVIYEGRVGDTVIDCRFVDPREYPVKLKVPVRALTTETK